MKETTQKTILFSDFDGTLETDLHTDPATLDPFSLEFGRLFSALTEGKMSVESVHAYMLEGYGRIRRAPQLYGWVRGAEEMVVASASDAYLRAAVMGAEMLDRLNLLRNPTDRGDALHQVYKAAYPFAQCALRPEAPGALNRLHQAGVFVEVVTNADPKKVRDKIAAANQGLGPLSLDWILHHVHGFANKSVVTQHPLIAPETIKNPHLSRPIYTRRGHLFELLESLCSEEDDLYFLGDNADMDLHGPGVRYPNAKLILVANDDTPNYDLRYFATTRNCFVIRSLAELPRILGV